MCYVFVCPIPPLEGLDLVYHFPGASLGLLIMEPAEPGVQIKRIDFHATLTILPLSILPVNIKVVIFIWFVLEWIVIPQLYQAKGILLLLKRRSEL